MIELEASDFIAELSTAMVVDGSTISAVVGGIEQKRHKVSGMLIETMQITSIAMDFGPAVVGQVLSVNGVEWEVDEAIRESSSLIVVNLSRPL